MRGRGVIREPGFRFKDGTLFVFSPEGVTLVHGWPRLEAARKRPTDPHWEPYEPEFQVVRPFRRARVARQTDSKPQRQLALPLALPRRPSLAEQRRRAFAAFRTAMPPDVAAAVEPFASGQWALLHMLRDAPESIDLLLSNPALTFALAQHARYESPCAPSELRVILTRRQREMLGWLGYPATEAAARALRKLVPTSVSSRTLEGVRAALAHPAAAKRLAHLPQLNAGVVALLEDARLARMATAALLDEVLAARREAHHSFTAHRLRAVIGLAQDLDEPITARRISSRAALDELHDALAVRYSTRYSDRILACRFGKPPVPGTPDIVPLTTPDQLVAEGVEQSNCVATYAMRVEARTTYIYRVLRPERATLSLVRGPNGAWERDELYAAGNKPVSARTAAAIDRWLDGHSL